VWRLQTKENNGLTNIKSKLLQQTTENKKQVDDAPCEVKEFYEIKDILIGILIDFIILYGLERVILAHINAV
jgi:hypothetical protein